MGGTEGLAFFDFPNERFREASYRSDVGQSPEVQDLLAYSDRLFVGDRLGVSIIDLQTEKLIAQVRFPVSNPEVFVNDLQLYEGVVVAGTNMGAFSISVNGVAAPLATDDNLPDEIEVYGMDISPAGELWMVGRQGIMKTASVSDEISLLISERDGSLPGDQFGGISFDSLGRLWIGGTRGLVVWDLEDPHPVQCRMVGGSNTDRTVPVAFVEAGLGPFVVYGSWGAWGVNTRMSPIAPGVRRIMPGETHNPGLPRSSVWRGHIGPQGHLFVAMTDGLYREREVGSGDFILIGQDEIGTSRVTGLANGPLGRLWVAGYDGVFIVDGLNVERLEFPIALADGSNRYHTSYMARAIGDDILITSTSGLLVIDAATQELRLFFRTRFDRAATDDVKTVDLKIGRILHLDVNGEDVFLTGDRAAYRVNIRSGEVLASTIEASEAGLMQPGRLNGVSALPNGIVFLAADNGIVKTDRDFSFFETINRIGSVRIGPVFGVIRDLDDFVWFGTENNDLFKYDHRENQWGAFGVQDGLLARGTSERGLAQTPDGALVHSNSGLTIFNPRGLRNGLGSPMELVVRDRDSGDNLHTGDKLALSPGRRGFSFEFSVPGLIDPDMYQVSFKLEGSEKENRRRFVELDERLNLEGLAPGRYALQFQLYSISGPTAPPVAMVVDVLANWWETKLAQWGVFAVILASAVGLFAWRSTLVERRYQLVADERKRIAQNLHDTFLQDVIAARMIGRNLPAAATRDQSDITDRMMELLESATNSARSSVHSLSKLTDVPPISQAIRECAPPARLAKDVDIRIEESGDAWIIGRQRRFFIARIVQEAINNACKHADAATIDVRLEWTPRRLQVTVRDDGRGFDLGDEERSSGYGLGAMRRMADAGRVKLQISSAPGDGTQIDVQASRLPL